MASTYSRWKDAVRYLLLATLPVALLFGVAEGITRLLPGDFSIRRPFFLPAGQEDYFGTRYFYVPYVAMRPYYWLMTPNPPYSNRLGFRGREITLQKSPGRIRIACIGCSCTVGGQEPYPERLERLLGEALGTTKYEVINASAGGNSTYQGLQIFEKHVLALQPDIVTIYFGWNDRWVHDGRQDDEHRVPTAWEKNLVGILSNSRFIQALMYLADRWRGHRIEQRVPVEKYGVNLQKFIRLCRQRGIRILLCTTPDGSASRLIERKFDPNSPLVNWDRDLYLMFKDKGDSPVAVWKYLQDLYNAKVREVARGEGVELIDLDVQVAERRKLYHEPPHHLFKDGIHFTELGLQEVARIFAWHILEGSERETLDKYLDSPAYYRANAEQFIHQYQFAPADYMLTIAEAASTVPIPNSVELRQVINAERPFYDNYYGAQFEIWNGGDLAKAIKLMQSCLEIRPSDDNLRLDLAAVALAAKLPNLCLNTVQGPSATYSSSENVHKALWLAVDAARALGKTDFMRSQLEEIRRLFPDDARAKAMLDRSG